MSPQRPTTLQLMTAHCPKALDHYEAGTYYDRDIFAVGTAAHDILCALGRKGPDAVEPTKIALMAAGREGIDAEAPLRPDAVAAGAALALAQYARMNGQLGTDAAQYEVGLAVTSAWEPVGYDDPRAWLRTRLDVLDRFEDGDEDFTADVLCVTDYKSAWPAGGQLLDSLQQRAQALVALAHHPDASVVRRRIVNLRTGADHDADIPSDDPVLDEWRADIAATIEAANARPRIARPGPRCLGCPYVRSCSDAQDALGNVGTPEGAAKAYAVAVALVEAIKPLAREATANGPMTVDGGEVGYITQTKKALRAGAALELWDRWRGEAEDNGLARGFIAVAELGNHQAGRLGMKLFPSRKQKDERNAYLESLMETYTERYFGVRPVVEREPSPAREPGEGE